MAAQATKLDIIYADSGETVAVVVTLGDSIRGQDWALVQYPDDPQMQDERGGMYSIALAAKRQHLRGSEGDWLDFLDLVTIPDDGAPAETPEAGESDGPPSAD